MKRFVMAMGLALSLSASAMAGDMHTGDFVPPPPPPGTAHPSSATSPGDIPTGDFAQQLSNEARLIVLRTIFSLFAR